jgi:hypothetical protein
MRWQDISFPPPTHQGEHHEQGYGFKEKRQEKAGQDHEGEEGGQAGKKEQQVIG